MEAALAGALRREKLAEDAVRRLEAEIECMNRLVCLVIINCLKFCLTFS